MMGHVPDALAEVLSDMNENAIGLKDILAIVTGHRHSSQCGTWTNGGGIDLPCTYNVYGHTDWMT